ncbi:hypothetical protein [Tessaracoccus flavus]|nr:hypothetical protein [Tessaracoccus flavus]SDY34787.1 hypothetical protein SAMN05428934_101424 [Tessaracoccus flavus]
MPDVSKAQMEVLEKLRSSGAVDFEKIGGAVTELAPKLFDPGTVADDYIATGYSSVIHVWKTGMALEELGRPAELQEMADRATKLAEDVQRVAGPGRIR